MVHTLGKVSIQPIIKLWLRKVEGMENIPKYKPFIIASNHSSYIDGFLPPALIIPRVDKKIHALVNSYYWKSFIARYFLDMWEAIPVFVKNENDSKKKNKIAFEKSINYLNKNEIIMIFPEGTRNDGELKKAYAGVAKLALKAKVPVLPVGIIDSNKVFPKGKIFPRFTRCEVKIGKLMYFEKYYNKKINEKVSEEITRNIMNQIAKLIGKKYNY